MSIIKEQSQYKTIKLALISSNWYRIQEKHKSYFEQAYFSDLKAWESIRWSTHLHKIIKALRLRVS